MNYNPETAGRRYRLESATNLTGSDWRPVPGCEDVPGTGTDVDLSVNSDPVIQQSYRLVLLPE